MEAWAVQNKGNLYGKSARVEVVEGLVSLETIPPKYRPTVCKMPDLSEKSYQRARLIAAAPDLLAAVEMAVQFVWDELRENPDKEDIDGSIIGRLVALQTDLLGSLRKAKGGV